ncbi:hypothetical protein Droror1_Dr00009319 [Drosera rotundifolia]
MPIQSQILGGQSTCIDNWVDDPNLQEWKEIVLAEYNGNGPRRILVNGYDHDDTSWEHVRAVSPGSLSLSSCSSSSESDFEVICHDGERVDQESWRGVRVKVDGEGDQSENKGVVRSENEVRVLPTVPPADVSLEPYCQMFPISNNQVIVQVTCKNIPPPSQGTKIWVTRSWLLLGVIDRISGPAGRLRYIVRCNIDGDVPSRVELGTSVSIVQGLADRVQSDKDEKASHWDDLSDDRKEAACKQMLETEERKNDQRQRNCTVNRHAPSDKNVNTRGMSSGSQAPSQEDTS